jgi:hypothetical protein
MLHEQKVAAGDKEAAQKLHQMKMQHEDNYRYVIEVKRYLPDLSFWKNDIDLFKFHSSNAHRIFFIWL